MAAELVGHGSGVSPGSVASPTLRQRSGFGTKTAAAGSPPVVLWRWALAGLVATSVVVIGAVLGGAAFVSHIPGAWFFGTPGGPFGSLTANGNQPPMFAVFMVYGGLIVLIRVWIGFLRTVHQHPGMPVRRIVGVIVIWSLPLLAAPPTFSPDAYSYAGQGEMVSYHINPYVYGTGVLGATPFVTFPGPVWANTPSPYGPTFLSVDGLAADLAGHEVLPDLILLRLLELGGLGLVVAGLPTLARAAGRDPASVVALAVGSPLALATLVGGAHNDALMVGLLVAGLAVARRIGPAPGIVLCARAAGVKAPAALGVVVLGWTWAGPMATTGIRLWRTLGAGVIAVATLGVVGELSGLGWGWLRTLTAADQIHTGVTPVTAVAKSFVGIAHLMHIPLSFGAAQSVLSALGLCVAGIVGAWLIYRSPRLGTERSLGLALLTLALLSPILWGWYLTWGLIVLAPVAGWYLRRVIVAISVVGVLIGASAVIGIFAAVRLPLVPKVRPAPMAEPVALPADESLELAPVGH